MLPQEEVRHRNRLFDLSRTRFGEYLPPVRRQDVNGFVRHKPLWLTRPLGLVVGGMLVSIAGIVIGSS